MSHHSSVAARIVPGSEGETERAWLVVAAGRRFGPLSTLELAYAARHGIVTGDCLIWRDGLPRWFLASEVAGLIPDDVAHWSPALERHRSSNPLLPDASQRRGAISPYALASPGTGPRSYEICTFDDSGRPTLDLVAVPEAAASVVPNAAPEVMPEVVPAAPASAGSSPRQSLAIIAASDSRQAALLIDTLRRCEARADNELAPYFSTIEPGAGDTVGSHSVTRRIAEMIAQQIVILLKRNDIDTIDELTSNTRLRSLATVVYDAVPATARFTISQTVGRDFVEERIFDVLSSVRGSFVRTYLSPEARADDLHRMVLAQAPALARTIDEAVASTLDNVSTTIKSNWTLAMGLFRAEAPAEIAAAASLPPLLSKGA